MSNYKLILGLILFHFILFGATGFIFWGIYYLSTHSPNEIILPGYSKLLLNSTHIQIDYIYNNQTSSIVCLIDDTNCNITLYDTDFYNSIYESVVGVGIILLIIYIIYGISIHFYLSQSSNTETLLQNQTRTSELETIQIEHILPEIVIFMQKENCKKCLNIKCNICTLDIVGTIIYSCTNTIDHFICVNCYKKLQKFECPYCREVYNPVQKYICEH